ncbi:GlxA family transcriptional regulator [Planctobacterium marinum]|uniref:Transcriptional regulator n=1 Tax=Planctobacterium marinum TaxID=1631968 RepID=A0AA48KU57_9ALTE|nr:transcriptional regulator [Planctobacterium marinum]
MHRIGFVAYEGIQMLDLVGPLESFALIKQQGALAYETCVVGPSRKIASESGITIQCDYLLEEAPRFDTLVIPGGTGARTPEIKETLKPWLVQQFSQTARLICVCTGVFLVADLPQLHGMKVTTHWDYAEQLQRQYPHLKVSADSLFVQNDNFFSSAGVLSGIDLALHVIELDHGIQVAASAAQYLVTYLKRSGYQSQFSDPLKFQSIDNNRLKKAHQWLLDNLSKPITVSDFADSQGLSERHFNRLVKQHHNLSARHWLEHIRLEQAKIFLSRSSSSIKSVAFQVGYASADSFRRAFKRKFGIEPSAWRQNFS